MRLMLQQMRHGVLQFKRQAETCKRRANPQGSSGCRALQVPPSTVQMPLGVDPRGRAFSWPDALIVSRMSLQFPTVFIDSWCFRTNFKAPAQDYMATLVVCILLTTVLNPRLASSTYTMQVVPRTSPPNVRRHPGIGFSGYPTRTKGFLRAGYLLEYPAQVRREEVLKDPTSPVTGT